MMEETKMENKKLTNRVLFKEGKVIKKIFKKIYEHFGDHFLILTIAEYDNQYYLIESFEIRNDNEKKEVLLDKDMPPVPINKMDLRIVGII